MVPSYQGGWATRSCRCKGGQATPEEHDHSFEWQDTVGCHGKLHGHLLVQSCQSPNQRLQYVDPPETSERILHPFRVKGYPNLTVGEDIHPYFHVTLQTPISSVNPSYVVEPSHFNGPVLHAQVLAGKAGFSTGWNYSPP